MMGGIFFWLILGVVLYLLFSRRGGMSGCCGGGHGHNPSEFTGRSANRFNGHADPHDDIIDLKKEDYHVH